jgi:hypothetical protein
MALVGLTAAAGLLIPAAAASAATPTSTPAHAAAAVQTVKLATSCNEQIAVDPFINGAQAEWIVNGCHYQGRVHIKCEFSGDRFHDYNGGWVRSVGLNDRAVCASGGLLFRAAWQWRIGPGHTVHTQWFFP